MFFGVFLIILFLTIAGLAEAGMDALAHDFEGSIFKDANPNFWNPIISGGNKWKNGDRNQGERFFLSSTLLVGFTEGWHLFKMVRTLFLFGAVALICGWIIALICMIVFKGSFTIFYNNFRD
jgi:hypothetical protein